MSEQSAPSLPPSDPTPTRFGNLAMALAACAGLGLGVGSALAVSRAAKVDATSTVIASPTVSGAVDPKLAVAPADEDLAELPAAVNPVNPPSDEAEEPSTDSLLDEDAPPPVLEDDSPQAPKHDPAVLKSLVKLFEARHKELHASAEAVSADKAIDQAIETVFSKNKTQRRFAKEFYASFGKSRFVRDGALTKLGEKVMRFVSELEDHALPLDVYDRTKLEQELAAVLAKLTEDGSDDDAGVQSLVRGFLEAPTFEAAEVLERLSAMPELPTPQLVAEVAGNLSQQRAPTSADALNDVHVFKAFLNLTLDMRFIKRAGPTTIRSREAVFDRDRRQLKDLIAQILAEPRGEGISLLFPPHPQYRAMVKEHQAYRKMVAQGGCPKLPDGWRFRSGSHGEEVKKLQARLICENYLTGEPSGVYDEATVQAVTTYQTNHDIPESGAVDEATMKALNVSMEFRVKQIGLALQRLREGKFDRMGPYFIRVNLPTFRMRVYENGQVIRENKVIVGTNRLDDDKVKLIQGHINRTKLMGTRLYEVIVNPTWILPKRVEEGELKSSLERDENYLAKSNIKKIKLGSGTEVYIQGSGDGNALGKVKFLLEESNAIYLHDTDKRHLFNKQRRDFSHGCMRVHEAIDFGKWLLERDGWAQSEIDRAFAAKSAQRGFKLRKPINLVTEYVTVDISAEGRAMFYADIYGYDSAYFNNNLPVREYTRWGSSKMRPRWVPLVEQSQVDEWRKAGKTAPRNLGPDGKPKQP